MPEVLSANIDKIKNSKVLGELGLKEGGYILLSAHREENIDIEDNFFSLMDAVNKAAELFDMPVIYSTHPRSADRIEKRGFKFHSNVRSLKPFGFSDYNRLQLGAYCVVSDSGTLPEEASYFKFPAVCIRTSTERPEALDRGNFILAGISAKEVLQAVKLAVDMNKNGDLGTAVPDYTDENVSMKVVKIIQSYTGIVNRVVWRKQ
jgi:UDP-N-acetylglucosamine 2-epimerase (non-hydrolysing)